MPLPRSENTAAKIGNLNLGGPRPFLIQSVRYVVSLAEDPGWMKPSMRFRKARACFSIKLL